MAMNKKSKFSIAEQCKIDVCNVRAHANKEVELQQELNLISVDIAIIPETKKKLEGSTELENYIVI